MSGMFSHCSFENIDLSNFNTQNVTDMSNMFSYCFNIKLKVKIYLLKINNYDLYIILLKLNI